MNELQVRNAGALAAPSDITLRDVVTPMFRRRRLMGVSFLTIMALAVVATIMLSGTYKCSMEILVNRERMDPSVSAQATNQAVGALPLTEEEINSEAELLTSPDLLKRVVLANNLQDRERHTLSAMLSTKQP
jgi:uncharacterized protein involved in exopolysaccharide biosynthesis